MKREVKFYNFRQKYSNLIINNKYKVTSSELMEIIDNLVVDLKEINKDCWMLELEENIIDNTNLLYVSAI